MPLTRYSGHPGDHSGDHAARSHPLQTGHPFICFSPNYIPDGHTMGLSRCLQEVRSLLCCCIDSGTRLGKEASCPSSSCLPPLGSTSSKASHSSPGLGCVWVGSTTPLLVLTGVFSFPLFLPSHSFAFPSASLAFNLPPCFLLILAVPQICHPPWSLQKQSSLPLPWYLLRICAFCSLWWMSMTSLSTNCRSVKRLSLISRSGSAESLGYEANEHLLMRAGKGVKRYRRLHSVHWWVFSWSFSNQTYLATMINFNLEFPFLSQKESDFPSAHGTLPYFLLTILALLC